MNSQTLKKYKIPDTPGVYLFMKGKEILYVGKATSLRDRVRSYFSKGLFGERGPMILDMVFKAEKIKWVETDSVLEALILETSLIKKHQPYYNTKEKSDKSFNYVCITSEDFPKVVVKRGRELDKELGSSSSVFGPFTSIYQLKEALRIIRKIFPFLDDKSGVRGRYEFYKQIKLVPDSSGGQKAYLKNIKNIKLFFEGKKLKILRDLEKDMKILAKNGEFERAGEAKRQIFALKHINDVALIKENRTTSNKAGFRIEAYDIAHTSGRNMVGAMAVIESGEPKKSEYRKFIIKNYDNANDTGALTEVLNRRFGHPEWPYPKLVVLDGGIAQINAFMNFSKKVGIKIPYAAVVKDERHRPKKILRSKKDNSVSENDILLANHEAHRFAISYHRQRRGKIV